MIKKICAQIHFTLCTNEISLYTTHAATDKILCSKTKTIHIDTTHKTSSKSLDTLQSSLRHIHEVSKKQAVVKEGLLFCFEYDISLRKHKHKSAAKELISDIKNGLTYERNTFGNTNKKVVFKKISVNRN